VDKVERLIRVFRAHGTTSPVSKRLDALLELEQLHDPRVLEFMLTILADPEQPTEVRLHVLKHTRNGMLGANQRPRVAGVLLEVLDDRSSSELHLQAVLALGEFTGVNGVVAALGALARNTSQTLELRHAAYSSLDRAGPTCEYLTLLHDLVDDDTFGLSARTTLAAWAQRTSECSPTA
jgi:hypothetical protein